MVGCLESAPPLTPEPGVRLGRRLDGVILLAGASDRSLIPKDDPAPKLKLDPSLCPEECSSAWLTLKVNTEPLPLSSPVGGKSRSRFVTSDMSGPGVNVNEFLAFSRSFGLSDLRPEVEVEDSGEAVARYRAV